MSRPLPPHNRRLPIPGVTVPDEQYMALIASLLSELCITRQRLDTVERLLARKGMVGASEIEGFSPLPIEAAARDRLRGQMIAHVMEPVRAAFEREIEQPDLTEVQV